MSGRAGYSDEFHQRVLFNLFYSSLNEDHVLDTPASSQHGKVMKRNATPRVDNDHLLKSRKRRSKVWKEFTPVTKSDGKKKAICDHCNKEFVGESKKGTSHLLNHLKICPEKRRKEGGGNKPSGNGNLTAHVVTGEKSTADLELSSLDLVRSAIMRGGKKFMNDLLHVYRDEKQKLCESFTKLSCRFSLRVDMVDIYCYSSCRFMTVYYIDENWEMKRNILFLQDKKDLEELRVFNLDESLCSIVWENYDVRDKSVADWGDIPGRIPFGDNFKGFVSLQGYMDYLVNKKWFYIDVVSRATKVESVSDIIKNMLGYDLFKKVDKALKHFVLCDNDEYDLWKRCQSSLGLMMCALEYKEAFLRLEHIDCAFRSVSLTRNEWDVVTAACDCLEVLNDVTCSLSSNKCRTANSCIPLILNIYKKLLQLGSNDSNPHSYTEKIASRIRNNFIEGYWKGNSLVISIAAFFDPRFKMDLVRDLYNIIYPMEVEVHLSRFFSELRHIYNCYADVPDDPTSSISITSDVSFGIPELDSYLREEPLGLAIENLEILAWWRNSHFPTLARMACDFLAVPICEVNSDIKVDIKEMNFTMDKFFVFEWTKFWLQYSHHEVQIVKNPPSYHRQVDRELDGSDIARMTLKIGYTAFFDDLLCVHEEEKQKAAKYLNELSCSISLEFSEAVDAVNYFDRPTAIITVQFIDEVWKLQRKILYLEVDSDYYRDSIGVSSEELNAGRNLCSIVHSHDLNIDECLSRIQDRIHDPVFLPFSGNFQEIQSFRYYINESIFYSVCQKMANIFGYDIFYKIEDCYKHVHEKYPNNDKFEKNNWILSRNDPQSWERALEFRETFLELEDTDPDFVVLDLTTGEFESMNLTNEECDALIAGYNCLKVFEDVTSEHLSRKEYRTANVCLPLICDIYKRLQGLHLIDGKNDYICQFASHLKDNLVNDYWDENGLALAIAAVLDPRFKMDVVQEWYNLIYNDEAEVRIQKFIEELKRCHNYYGKGSELDLYLRAPKFSIYTDFGILTWWRDSTKQFPTLARMARDILAIPVCSDDSAMHHEIEEMFWHQKNCDIHNAFICTPSWLENLKGK